MSMTRLPQQISDKYLLVLPARGGKGNKFEIQQSTCSFHPMELNLLECCQSLTDLGEGKCQLWLALAFYVGRKKNTCGQPTSVLSLPPGGGAGNNLGKFMIWTTGSLENLRPHHETTEYFASLPQRTAITKGLFAAISFTQCNMSSCQEKKLQAFQKAKSTI